MCLHSKMYNCASIENVYMLANSRILYLQCENAAFSTTDMLQHIIWVWSNGFLSKAHLTAFNICCLDCVDCMLLVLRQYLVYELIFDTFLATVNCLISGFSQKKKWGSKSIALTDNEFVYLRLSAVRRASSTTEWQMEPWMLRSGTPLIRSMKETLTMTLGSS